MRVLCIHGQGASPAIMETQTSAFRACLPPTWSYDYLEGPNDSEPGPGLKGVYPPPHFCFFERHTPEAMEEAIEYVQEAVECDGPYDAIIGFSQGASVAAAFLARSAESFKFAVFICAALNPPSTGTKEELEQKIGSLGFVDLPTLHCIGEHDTCYDQSMALSKSCDSSLSQILILPGGHDIPRDDFTSKNIAAAIEKCARKALSRH